MEARPNAMDALLGLERRAPDVTIHAIERPVTIERTTKSYKLGMLVGRGFMWLGIGLLCYSLHVFTENFGRWPASVSEFLIDQPSAYVAAVGIVGGYSAYKTAVALAWWNNG